MINGKLAYYDKFLESLIAKQIRKDMCCEIEEIIFKINPKDRINFMISKKGKHQIEKIDKKYKDILYNEYIKWRGEA